MELSFWTKFLLPIVLIYIDLTASIETTTEPIRNYGNRIRRVRAHREKTNTDKTKREIAPAELKRTERQTNTNNGPPADPSYDFAFRTPEYQRRESSDSLGRVRGLYSFIDDVGEKHLVRYAASADRGFEVFNSVPDASRYVQYSAPLYKTSNKARGRIAYERGPGRQYKFISSGPDQRRSESIGPDGVTRGAFSYLDDKGVQRTTQYIAGAGIGYRIVQDTTGPGTHLLPRPNAVEVGILYPQGGNRADVPASIPDDFGSSNGVSGFDDGSGSVDVNTGGVGVNTGIGNNSPGGVDVNVIDTDGFPDPGNDFDDNRPIGNPKPTNRGIGTVITNSGDTYFGIAPGASARAHVQNIDLKPWGEEAISPSEALRRDERRSQRLRFRG